MFLVLLLFYLCGLISHVQSGQDYRDLKEKTNAENLRKRLLALMHSYDVDATYYISDLKEVRFLYEESPHYEQGYMMGEIIDRYKKLVEHNKRMVQFGSQTVIDNLARVEQIQKNYLEVYHLVNMMHEIPQKWSHTEEFAENFRTKKFDPHEYLVSQNKFIEVEEKRRQDRREKMKMMKKYNKYIASGGHILTTRPPFNKTKYKRWWPIDYGWEISHEW